VISGFLITWLLLGEEERHGSIDLRLFYLRRAARILPPALACLALVAALRVAGLSDVGWDDLAAAAFFVRNLAGSSKTTAHYWSLAIEEQFYLLWPLGLIALGTRRRRLLATSALVAAAPLWRQANIKMFGAENLTWARLDLRYDGLLLGALIALARIEPATRARLDRIGARLGDAGVALAAAGLAALLVLETPRLLRPALLSLQALGVATVLAIVLSGGARAALFLLELPPARWLGRISYSLYLWQQGAFFGFRQGVVTDYPENVVTALARGALGWLLLERPLDAVRARLRRRPSARAEVPT